jgi:putative nucleotidyltransferase with HDIG domain
MPSNNVFSANSIRFISIIILTGLIVFSLFFIFNVFTKDFFNNLGISLLLACVFLLLTFIIYRTINIDETLNRSMFFLLGLIPFFTFIGHLLSQYNPLFLFILPLGIIIIVIKYFFNESLSFGIYFSTISSIFLSLNPSIQWMFLQIFTGLLILFLPFDSKKPSRIIGSIIVVCIASILISVSLKLTYPTFRPSFEELTTFSFIQSLLLLFSYFIIPFLERIFSFKSAFSLNELGNLDNFLLKELAIKAPGTYQHSIQVSYLAEAAGQKIHVNSLLCRVGGLYHDIGKLANPDYFNENIQDLNPLQYQSFHRSAALIIKHVKDGIELGRRYRLPEVIIDFIRTHHGTTKVEYFYRKFKASENFFDVNEADFTYPGPKPFSREQSIVMLADTIEAACRSLKNPTESDLFDLINRLVEYKIKMGQFQESRLSFKEIDLCKEAFKDYIKTFYHQRISYPEPINSGQEFL